LANMKTVLAEWMAKAEHLEGQLLSAHKLQEKAQAALHGKEDQIRDHAMSYLTDHWLVSFPRSVSEV
ncbi:hypothetical protein PSY73_23480, partial [Shigella flexneri]|nr:hypothetical protein [Shigella flexneri]